MMLAFESSAMAQLRALRWAVAHSSQAQQGCEATPWCWPEGAENRRLFGKELAGKKALADELSVPQTLRLHQFEFPGAGDDDVMLGHEIELGVQALVRH